MSKTNKGGTSLRLITGLTAAALVISGVVAANLHSSRLVAACTITSRSGGSTILAGDVALASCNGLQNSHTYKLRDPSGTVTGWSTVFRGASNGNGSSPLNHMKFVSDGTNDYAQLAGQNYTYQAGALGSAQFSAYILIDPAASSVSSLELYDVTAGSVAVSSANITLPTPVSQSGVMDMVAPFTITSSSTNAQASVALVSGLAGEQYKFGVIGSLTGWNTSGAGTSPYRFDGSGLTGTITVAFSGATQTDPPTTSQFDTVSGTNSTAKVGLFDSSGNLILTPSSNVSINNP
jgi:hypothetical protein